MLNRDRIDTFPALAAYMTRIGAEMRNFRRYVIKELDRDRYHYDRYIITIDGDGGITVKDARGEDKDIPEEIKPTQEEREAIKAGCATVDWPKHVDATHVENLRQKLGSDAELFVFRKSPDEVTFVQQRVYDRAGMKKSDLPWTFWSDGEWRCMEPGGLLPLWGLERLSVAACVLIHEGAKAAQRVQQMLDNREDHPWFRDLERSVQIGSPGGAPNPHRVDWSPLRKLEPHVRVYIICDNDPSGENAAPFISRAVQRRLRVVRFGAAFKPHFDLADPFPDFPNPRDVPTLEDCTEPATWATTKKRLRAEFVEEWLFTVRPAAFVNRDRLHRRYDEAEFNAAIGPFSDVPNVAALLRKYHSAKAEGLTYEPGKPSGRIALGGAQVINMYQPSPIKPVAGDVTPWEDFLERLIPSEKDRDELKRWVATLIARPDIRMTYSVLLISITQGVGKTTFADIVVELVGKSNCSFPKPAQVVDSKFTHWQAFKRLAVIAEIYDGQTAKAYNKLKDVLTDENCEVEEKYEKPFLIKNWIHVIASSNSFRALKMDQQDRRWFIPEVTEEKQPDEYWPGFRHWLNMEGGLAAVRAWAPEYLKEVGPIPTGRHAPMSETKERSIEEGRSLGERLIADLGQNVAEATREDGTKLKIVLRQDEIRSWLAARKASINQDTYGRHGTLMLETPEKIAGILRSCGLILPRERFNAGGERFRIVANFPVEPGTMWEALKPDYHLPPNIPF